MAIFAACAAISWSFCLIVEDLSVLGEGLMTGVELFMWSGEGLMTTGVDIDSEEGSSPLLLDLVFFPSPPLSAPPFFCLLLRGGLSGDEALEVSFSSPHGVWKEPFKVGQVKIR